MRNLLKTLLAFFASILLLFVGGLVAIYLSVPNIAALKNEDPSTTAFIEFRKAEAELAGQNVTIKQEWIPLRSIPEIFKKTVIVAEDASFWIHEGIDWYEVEQSFKKNLEEGEISRGGSTITQQLAKNMYLSPRKTVYRKMREWFIAKELEKELTKSRILELYLNIIELGRGVFGIGAASQKYFGKQPYQLTLSEMVRLAAIIPSPLTIKPNSPSRSLRWRSNIILRRLYKFNFISQTEYRQTKDGLEMFFDGDLFPLYF